MDTDNFPFENLITANSDVNTAEATVQYYRIVVSRDCSAELLEAAKTFAKSITEATGIAAGVIYDNETDGRETLVTEVILGDADRELSSFLMKDLKENDYLCSSVEGTIVIGGKSNSATLLALERFCSELLPKATSLYLMNSDDAFVYHAEYDTSSITLNTYDLNEYVIVYDASSGEDMILLANKLQALILEKSGYCLSLYPSMSYSGKHIGLSLDPDGGVGNIAYVMPEGKNIMLRAKDIFGLSVATRDFYEYLFKDGGKCTLSSTIECSYNDSTYTIASIEREGLFPLQSISDTNYIIDTIFNNDAPNAIFFGAMTEGDAQRLDDHIEYFCGYEAYGDEFLTYCSEDRSLTFIKTAEYDGNSPAVFVYRIGSADDGFLFVRISGELGADFEVDIAELTEGIDLPTIVMIHTRSAVGSGYSVTVDNFELSSSLSEQYLLNGLSYTFACYSTKGDFNISAGDIDDNIGYRGISAQRISVFK